MSSPSQENGTVLNGWEHAKMDPKESFGQTQEEQTLGRFQKDIHSTREEQTQSLIQKEQQVPTKSKDQTRPLTGGAEKNTIIHLDGSRTNVDYDKYAEKIQDEINKSNAGRALKQETTQASYPEAQPSYDAKGKLNHIDFMPNKDR